MKKYFQPLNLNVCKPLYNELFANFFASADYDQLVNTNKWHNNVPVTDAIRADVGGISQYLKDELLLVSVFPNKSINIHADGAGTVVENTYRASINIPIWNCTDQTVTYFWDFPDQRELAYINMDKLGVRDIPDKDQLIKMCATTMQQPVLFRNEYPHSVENAATEIRYVVSWRFRPEIDWEQAAHLCGQYGLIA